MLIERLLVILTLTEQFFGVLELFLPAGKTKTLDGRVVPISSRLWTILGMRRTDPGGQTHPPNAISSGTK
jgi:hypothetical protein